MSISRLEIMSGKGDKKSGCKRNIDKVDPSAIHRVYKENKKKVGCREMGTHFFYHALQNIYIVKILSRESNITLKRE